MTQISIWLSFISTALAIYAAYTTWHDKHRNIEISYNWGNKISSQFNISFNFFNPSSRNISITEIKIIENGHSFSCPREPLLLMGRAKKAVFSASLPLNIAPSTSIDAVYPFQFLDKTMDLREYTLIFRVNGVDITQTIDLGKNTIDGDQFAKRFEKQSI